MVYLGALEAPEEFLAENKLSRGCENEQEGEGEGITKELSAETERALVVILATFMQMDKTDLLIFHGLYHGRDMTSIGREMGVTKEAIRKRVVNMAKANPKIMKAFGAMKRKGIGGAKRTRRSFTQEELF